jgi:hypothetical protein
MPILSFTPGVVTVAWTRHVSTIGIGGRPGIGIVTVPLGVSTALLIVVFGSVSVVRLAQEAGAAGVPEAGRDAAAIPNACADGAIDVPATVRAATTGTTAADTRGR